MPKRKHIPKHIETDIHYNEIILTNPKEYNKDMQKIGLKCYPTPKTPPISIPTPTHHYSPSNNPNSITSEDTIEISQDIYIDKIEFDFTHQTQQSTNIQNLYHSTPNLNNITLKPNI